ncbi:formylglycine-generating enzyme family protein [Paenibacillus sp. FA6]|uniref:formylglycine-generating enzyme family protein n=1 Tax=Paenibacillus sp. FA6 TaxID=3413029 RepID=UPI003F659A87
MMQNSTTKSCCSVSRDQGALIRETNIKGTQIIDLKDMVQLPSGEFILGSEDEESSVEDGETIRRKVYISSFYMDKYAVTNEQFSRFIAETGYVTDAEKYDWSFVFHLFVNDVLEQDILGSPQGTPWWIGVQGACWKYPEGRKSSISNRPRHPVVHVSWNDAKAYSVWAGKRLPTEAEWEYAASSGVIDKKYPWGNDLHQNEEHHCNIWQGDFPHVNHGDDGFLSTAPVDSYEPNEFGLYNMSGNVWEWSEESFTNQPSDSNHILLDPSIKLIKGGSYLCHLSYCNRYRISARTFNTIDSSTGHMGFRCVANLL